MTVLIGDLFRQPNSVSRENYFAQIIIEITRFNIRAIYIQLSQLFHFATINVQTVRFCYGIIFQVWLHYEL